MSRYWPVISVAAASCTWSHRRIAMFNTTAGYTAIIPVHLHHTNCRYMWGQVAEAIKDKEAEKVLAWKCSFSYITLSFVVSIKDKTWFIVLGYTWNIDCDLCSTLSLWAKKKWCTQFNLAAKGLKIAVSTNRTSAISIYINHTSNKTTSKPGILIGA